MEAVHMIMAIGGYGYETDWLNRKAGEGTC